MLGIFEFLIIFQELRKIVFGALFVSFKKDTIMVPIFNLFSFIERFTSFTKRTESINFSDQKYN